MSSSRLQEDRLVHEHGFPLSAEVQLKLKALKASRPELSSVSRLPLETWLKQFSNKADQETALLLLEKVQLFDLDATRSGLQKIHHQLFSTDGLNPEKTRLSYLGAGKSGALMAYFYRQANNVKADANIPEKHFLEFNQMGASICPATQAPVENLAIIDDIILSGRQSIEYLEALKEKFKAYKQIDLYCLAGTEKGVERVQKAFPNIRVRVVQHIQHIYEGGKNALFNDAEKGRIKDLLERYSHRFPVNGILKPKQREGLVVFFYNSPDETIPLLTHKGTGPNGWKPPFPRYWGEKVD